MYIIRELLISGGPSDERTESRAGGTPRAVFPVSAQSLNYRQPVQQTTPKPYNVRFKSESEEVAEKECTIPFRVRLKGRSQWCYRRFIDA